MVFREIPSTLFIIHITMLYTKVLALTMVYYSTNTHTSLISCACCLRAVALEVASAALRSCPARSEMCATVKEGMHHITNLSCKGLEHPHTQPSWHPHTQPSWHPHIQPSWHLITRNPHGTWSHACSHQVAALVMGTTSDAFHTPSLNLHTPSLNLHTPP